MVSILDELKAGLNSLLDRVAGDDAGPVPERSVDDVRAELERRAAARTGALGRVHPIAARAGASSAARAARARIARAREQRVHARRAQQADAAQRDRDAAFEQLKREAAHAPGPTPEPRATRARRRRRPAPRRDRAIAKHYDTLDLPYGADFATVKARFRALMRKYHPDMHAGSPDKQKAAAELSKQITVAYNELERHLEGA